MVSHTMQQSYRARVLVRRIQIYRTCHRSLNTYISAPEKQFIPPKGLQNSFGKLFFKHYLELLLTHILHGAKPQHIMKKIKVHMPPPSASAICKDPVSALSNAQIAVLDPTGARSRLFSKDNPEAAKVGDILLVRQRSGEPFAGVCLNIRRRGVDTSILLRNRLTRVGVEMWYKIYSPNVDGIEVVQRRQKRARRARLYYMR